MVSCRRPYFEYTSAVGWICFYDAVAFLKWWCRRFPEVLFFADLLPPRIVARSLWFVTENARTANIDAGGFTLHFLNLAIAGGLLLSLPGLHYICWISALQVDCCCHCRVCIEFSKSRHFTQVDCWSAGVVTYILLGGYPPFSSPRMQHLFRLVKRARVSFDNVRACCVGKWSL